MIGLNLEDHLLIREKNLAMYGASAKSYEGSPYLNETFVMSYVYAGEQKYKAVPMRYNIAADVMEFQTGGRTLLLDPDPRIGKVEMGDHVFVVERLKLKTKPENTFLELMHEGKLSVLAKKSVNYRENNDITQVPAKYSRSADTYYYRIGDQPPSKLTTIKNLLESLPDHRDKATEFIKAEKISLKKEEDLLKLAAYYNSL